MAQTVDGSIERLQQLLALAQRPGTFEEGDTARLRLSELGRQQYGVRWRLSAAPGYLHLYIDDVTFQARFEQYQINNSVEVWDDKRNKTEIAMRFLRKGYVWFDLLDGPWLAPLGAVQILV